MANLDFGPLMTGIQRYAQRAQEEATLAAVRAGAYLYERTVERARQDAQWAQLADSIQVWSQDGRMVIGIHDQLLVSQAFQLEFGDETTPPSPLFRTMGPDMSAAEDIMNESYAAGMSR